MAQKNRRGREISQSTAIKRLDDLAKHYGYKTTVRSQGKLKKGDKKFYPDLIAKPYKTGAKKYVFEVEKTVNNNTIFKSLVSLHSFLIRNANSQGVLIVPKKSMKFVEDCSNEMTAIIRHYADTRSGAPKKIHIKTISFSDLTEALENIESWDSREGRKGRPPNCSFLPKGN